MNTITQLDLLVLRERGLTRRLSGVERAVRAIEVSPAPEGEAVDSTARSNLFVNGSFEFYDRSANTPRDWTGTGGAILSFGMYGADGATAVKLPAGATLGQAVAADQQAAVAVSVYARAQQPGASVAITLAHTPGQQAGTIFRIDPDGREEATSALPDDGRWYRFFRSFVLVGGAAATVTLGASGAEAFIDAAKYEKEDGGSAFIDATAFVSGDWGSSVHLRNLSAENIVAGTLTVGGAASSNPRISVLDGNNAEIVTIGNPIGGFYGVEVKGEGGLRISGNGSAEVTGGGRIFAGASTGARTELVAAGFAAYNNLGIKQVDISSTDGKVRVLGVGGIHIEGAGSLVAGALAGARVQVGADGIEAYNGSNVKQLEIASNTGKVRVLGQGAISVEGGGSLVAGTL